jgi:hypothetical protein
MTENDLYAPSNSRGDVKVVHKKICNSSGLPKLHDARKLKPAQRFQRSDEPQFSAIR